LERRPLLALVLVLAQHLVLPIQFVVRLVVQVRAPSVVARMGEGFLVDAFLERVVVVALASALPLLVRQHLLRDEV
jgi:hypothetical protein